MTATDVIARQNRAVRRLRRLFKIERAGGFDRRPPATVRRLVERRAVLIDDLLNLDRMRRSVVSRDSEELEQAIAELGREVRQSLHTARIRLGRLSGDLRMRCGPGLTTGIRDRPNGRLLGEI